MSKKTMFYGMFGEPRGLGNSMDCPGTNQLDIMLNDPSIDTYIDEIHVHWSITNEQVSFKSWDMGYMIDRYGQEFRADEYMPREDIESNIKKYMQPYVDRVTYDIHFREPNICRWGKEYHDMLIRALNGGYDYIYLHRPDSNLYYGWYDTTNSAFVDFLSSDINDPAPAVFIAPSPEDNMWRVIQPGQHETQKYAGLYILWANYESIMMNKQALKLIEPFFKLKAQNEHLYFNDLYKTEFSKHDPWLSFDIESRIDTGENLWAVILLATSACHYKFSVIDKLPFRSMIREAPRV